jgi:vitamin B12 transporter
MSPLRARALLASLAFALPLSAAAGGEDTPAPPDDASAAKPKFGEEVVVIGPRRRAPAADPTAAATVVDAARFAGEAKSVAELVATAPGVAVNQYGGLGQLATVSIRGSNADEVQVFVDGLPLNTAAGGGVDLSRIPRAWIQRIEVIRGAEGAVYGIGALGGAVNIVTRRDPPGSWSVEGTAGSFRTFDGSADAAIGGERWGTLGAVALDDTGGRFGYLFDPKLSVGNALEERERTHNASWTAGGLAKLWADVGDGRLDVALQLSGGARDLPGSPYHLTPGDGQRDARAGVTGRFGHPLAPDLDLVLTASARDERLAVTLTPSPEVRQRDLAATASAELVWTAGPSALSLRATGSEEHLDVDGAPGHARSGLALTLADDLALAPGLRLTPAVRWDADGRYHGFSAKMGASLRVAGPFVLRASGGHAFRVPSFTELYLSQGLLAANPDLVPEHAWSADAGVAADGRLGFLSVAAFAQLYRDLIVYEPDSFHRNKPFNDGKAQARGIELEAASAPLGPAALSASAAYTFLATETLRGGEAVLGKALPHRARHRLFARLAGERGPVAAHAEVQYVSLQFLDLANSSSLEVPAGSTVNVGASLRVLRRPDSRLDLEVRNLLDDRHLQDGFGNPLPGRMVMLTVRVAGGKDVAP